MKSSTKSRSIAVVAILLIAAAAVIYGWFRLVSHADPVACGYCMRPLRANLRVTAEIAGKETQVCCARCAVSEANQQGKRLRLVEVHDYPTGKSVVPSKAWFVEGSLAMACDHDAMRMNEMKGTQEIAYDRCSPGTFSFANKPDADAFIVNNGGSVISFTQLMGEAHCR